ncbi:PPIP5K2, partial [Cervus elaphus hippelaphus]
NIVMRELAPQFHIPWSIPLEAEDIPIVPTTSGTMMELRCVIAVIRHGDRTPKQKMKMEVRHQKYEVLDIARQLLMELGQNNDSEIEENKSKLEQLKTVLEMYGHFSGINRKVQLTYLPHGCPKTSSEEEDSRREEPSLLLVLKWGGELTPAGRVQAEELGRAFRCMYPGGQGDYAGFPGCGLLRLHSTYRHDLKIYASDEGRVQMTAAAFAKLTPSGSISLIKSMHLIKNPVKTCDTVYSLIQSLTSQIRHRMEDPKSSDIQLYHSETLELMLRRWSKLEKDFKTKNGRYDISKIPDIYDCIKYDVQHNGSLKLEDTMELYRLSKALADIVIPQEYGITKAEKLEIAKGYCTPLVRKIRSDLQRTQDDDTVNKLHPVYSRGVLSPERHVRTRLYFTSESHVHSLLSILRYGALCDDLSSEERFHVELHFSPGAKGCEEDKNLPSGYGYRPASRENEGRRAFKIDSDDEPHTSKKDEVDRAVILFKPMVSEPIHIHRKSPLPRSRKMATNEAANEVWTFWFILLFYFIYFAFLLQVVSENANYLRTPRTLVEQKQNPTVGSHCAGLFSTSVLGASSSAPNLQDYARTHRKKLTSSGCIDDATRGSAVKRFSISFARHPTNGFELYSMVPSICPLETLHNALSLKQVDEFLASIASPSSEVPRKTPETSCLTSRSSPIMRRKVSLNTYTPAKILPTPTASIKSTKASSKPVPSGPSTTAAPNTSSRKKGVTSKTEMHEHKKNTSKKK